MEGGGVGRRSGGPGSAGRLAIEQRDVRDGGEDTRCNTDVGDIGEPVSDPARVPKLRGGGSVPPVESVSEGTPPVPKRRDGADVDTPSRPDIDALRRRKRVVEHGGELWASGEAEDGAEIQLEGASGRTDFGFSVALLDAGQPEPLILDGDQEETMVPISDEQPLVGLLLFVDADEAGSGGRESGHVGAFAGDRSRCAAAVQRAGPLRSQQIVVLNEGGAGELGEWDGPDAGREGDGVVSGPVDEDNGIPDAHAPRGLAKVDPAGRARLAGGSEPGDLEESAGAATEIARNLACCGVPRLAEGRVGRKGGRREGKGGPGAVRAVEKEERARVKRRGSANVNDENRPTSAGVGTAVAAILREGETKRRAERGVGGQAERSVELAAVGDVVNAVLEELEREGAARPKLARVYEPLFHHVTGHIEGDGGEPAGREGVHVADERVGDGAVVNGPDEEAAEAVKGGAIPAAVVKGLDEGGIGEPKRKR